MHPRGSPGKSPGQGRTPWTLGNGAGHSGDMAKHRGRAGEAGRGRSRSAEQHGGGFSPSPRGCLEGLRDRPGDRRRTTTLTGETQEPAPDPTHGGAQCVRHVTVRGGPPSVRPAGRPTSSHGPPPHLTPLYGNSSPPVVFPTEP